MKYILLISILSIFTIACTTVKKQVDNNANTNQKTLVKCADKGTQSIKDSECQGAAKEEGGKVKDMIK